jgi:hypothetical protein
MRKILLSAAAATLVVSTWSFVNVEPAKAQTVYPWCAHYGGRDGGGAPSCGSMTYAQCMATISGMQGYCDRNPNYTEASPAMERRLYKPTRG